LSALDWHGLGPAGSVVVEPSSGLGLVDPVVLTVTVTVGAAAGLPFEHPAIIAPLITAAHMSTQERRE
jgi:hypothetical protein